MWRLGKKDQDGIYFWKGLGFCEAEWKDDKMNGIAHCIFENEIKMYVGEMKNSMRNGYGELKF